MRTDPDSPSLGPRLRILATIYRSPKYVVLSVIAAAAYYEVFAYFVSLNNFGIVIFSAPVYLVYLLAITASLLLTITIYSVSLRLRQGMQASSPAGLLASITTIVGGTVAGCACQAPILYNLLYFVGLNAFEASGVVTLLIAYSVEINSFLILLNLAAAYLLLSKISKAGEVKEIPGPISP